jgi:hypothetical protein
LNQHEDSRSFFEIFIYHYSSIDFVVPFRTTDSHDR